MNAVKHINCLFTEVGNLFHDLYARLGVSDSVGGILYTICNLGDSCLLGDIVSLTGMPKQTVNSALRKMEAEGLLRLEAAQKRRKQVCLTPEGKALADRTAGQMLRIENEILMSWEPGERELYLALTQRYLDQLREKAKELGK